MKDQLILGAGASGLTLGILLPSAKLIEGRAKVGGLSQTIKRDGFTFDQGPHIMFSRNKDVLAIMVESLGKNVHTSRRNNVVMINGHIVKYPIENDLSSLPDEYKFPAIRDFLERQINKVLDAPNNLEEWFRYNFGDTLTDVYFKPYNEKIWNLPIRELSMSWSERIPSPPWEDVLKGALGLNSEGYLHQLYYEYPAVGGYESLMDIWASKVSSHRIRTSSKLEQIRRLSRNHFILQINGKCEEFRGDIFSTLPLSTMAVIYQDLPRDIAKLIFELPVNPLITVNLAFQKRDDNKFTAIYIPDEDYLVNRLSFPGVFSPNNVPSEDSLLIQAEITAKPGDEVINWADAKLIDHVLLGLIKRHIVSAEDKLIFKYVDRIEHAYVVYPRDFEERRNKVLEYFESQNIYLNGRFGSHSYLNVDGILMQSIELARRFDEALDLNKIRELFGLSIK